MIIDDLDGMAQSSYELKDIILFLSQEDIYKIPTYTDWGYGNVYSCC
jgi:hypothetical protein